MQLQRWRRLASFEEASITTEAWRTDKQTNRQTRNRKHRRAAAKPAACAKPL